MKKKRKKSKRQLLQKEAWEVFSKWIRNRDKICITCPTGKAEHAGHFHHGTVCGKYSKMYFNEKNVNGQCRQDNFYASGKTSIYAMKLVQKYGPGVLDELNPYPREEMTDEDFENIIKKYS